MAILIKVPVAAAAFRDFDQPMDVVRRNRKRKGDSSRQQHPTERATEKSAKNFMSFGQFRFEVRFQIGKAQISTGETQIRWPQINTDLHGWEKTNL